MDTFDMNDAQTRLLHICGSPQARYLGPQATSQMGGADGFAFVIQRSVNRTDALGQSGNGLGNHLFILT